MSNKKSLAPLGLTLDHYKTRLDADPRGEESPECMIARLWERMNVPNPPANGGTVPLEEILLDDSVIDARPRPVVDSRDAKVVSAVIQWLATNSGRKFLHELRGTLLF